MIQPLRPARRFAKLVCRPVFRLVLLAVTGLPLSLSAQEEKAALPALTAAPGWTVELVAGPPLVDRPVEASLSPDGRLFVTEVSGTNAPVKQQLVDKPHRVLCLRDTDGDGKFDSRTVFADGLGFPEGCLWFQGSVYVAAPPVIWKFTDKDGDGVADYRTVWYDGKTLTGCANDLHGPYAGPDGWIYWGKGGFAKQTHPGADGIVRETAASHILRARPDGSGVETVINGGMDNPVGITWTAEGECILSNTFLQHPGGGKRDGLIHAVENGLWGKDHDIIEGLPVTGPLMPVMTHMGPAAPCGLATLRGDGSGDILACQFNMRKVSRHVLKPAGATFTTEDSDFLLSENPDFHPTDVLEDRDGSVLVVDTGGWYKICCPTSQIAKPQVTGGIYRLRRTTADAKNTSVDADSTAAGKIWSACRAGDAAAIRVELQAGAPASATDSAATTDSGKGSGIRAAALAVGRLRDREAVPALLSCLKSSDPGLVRATAEALGRCAAPGSADVPVPVQPLLEALRRFPDNRFLQHSVSDSIRLLANDAALAAAWKTEASPDAQAALLYAGHSRKGAWPDAATVMSCLSASTPEPTRVAALKLCEESTGWEDEGARILTQLTANGAPLPQGVEPLAARWLTSAAMRSTVAQWLDRDDTADAALRIISQARLPGLPDEFTPALRHLLEKDQGLELIRTVPAKARSPFVDVLTKLGHGSSTTPPNPTALLLLEPTPLNDALFSQLEKLFPDKPGDPLPESLPKLLSVSPLTTVQRQALLKHLPQAGPNALPYLVTAIAQKPDETLGLELLRSLDAQRQFSSIPAEVLDKALTAFPPSVKSALAALREKEKAAAEARRAGLADLASAAATTGDPARGHLVFQNAKAACATCHQIGYKGGTLGPDLSSIGAIRTELDLLEAIIQPSAGFVRSYEPLLVKLKDGGAHYGIPHNRSNREVTLGTAAGIEIRIPLSDIASTEPGEFSLMPAGFGESLSRAELIDLTAFLKSLR